MVRDRSPRPTDDAAAGSGSIVFDITAAITPRDYVSIDGTRYALARVGAFGLTDRARIDGLAKRIGELEALAERSESTPDDDREYESRVRELVALVLPSVPKAKLAKVELAQLVGLCTAFFVLWSRNSPLPRALLRIAGETSKTSPNPSRSRGSRTTTAARSQTGRRSRS